MDTHPDTFTAAIVQGPTPAEAIVQKVFNKVPMAQLKKWAKENVTKNDIAVLEASGNSFQIVRDLESIGLRARVLESCQMGKLKEAHANNDRISAVRIGKAFLSGTAKEVWVPDPQTQERRDWFLAYQKAVKRTTQITNRILSYLSDHNVRLGKKSSLRAIKQKVNKLRSQWTLQQCQLIDLLLADLEHAHKQRVQWRSLLAQTVLNDPKLLQIVRLCGVRDITAFAIGAVIGDISRFKSPASLVKYVGLNPAFDDSGKNKWEGGIGGHGRKDLRALLIQGAQAAMRSKTLPMAQWARKLMARKSAKNLAVAALARKLAVAIWYVMMGRWTQLEEVEKALQTKIGKIIGAVGNDILAKLKKNKIKYRQEIYAALLEGQTIYMVGPSPAPAPKDRGFIALDSSPAAACQGDKAPRPRFLAETGAQVASQRSPILRNGNQLNTPGAEKKK